MTLWHYNSIRLYISIVDSMSRLYIGIPGSMSRLYIGIADSVSSGTSMVEPVLEMTALARAFRRCAAYAQHMPAYMSTRMSIHACGAMEGI